MGLDMYRGDAFRGQAVIAHQVHHRIDRRMGAAAAGMRLDGDAGIEDVKRVGPDLEDAVGIVIAGAVEHLEEALTMGEGIGTGGKALARQAGGDQAVARAMADMQRLGHGAEIGLDAGCERHRQRQCHLGFGVAQPHQPRDLRVVLHDTITDQSLEMVAED